MKIALYIISILLANIVTTSFKPLEVMGFLIPCGSFLIGLTFIMRDYVQIQHGRKMAYVVIVSALALSAIASLIIGDGLRIVLASAVAFALSEATDTEVFTRLRAKLHNKIMFSGIVGGVLDSVIFTLIAGFPAAAIVGQMVVKLVMQILYAQFKRIKEMS